MSFDRQGSLVAVYELAARQHGVFSIAQLVELGIPLRRVQRLARSGAFRPVRRGVYAVAGAPSSPWQPLVGAALAAGPDSVISHSAAAWVHRFEGAAPGHLELTVTSRISLSGVRMHRTGLLPAAHVTSKSGILVTTPVRTIIDLFAGAGAGKPPGTRHPLERMLDDGAVRRLWTFEQVALCLGEVDPRHTASYGLLRELLLLREDEGNAASPLEQRVIRVFRETRIVPDPVLHHQIVIDGRVLELDLAWPQHLVGAEVDGWQHRSLSRSTFDRDRLRANLLEAHGWRIAHLTSAMDARTLIIQVARLLPKEALLQGIGA